MAKFGARLKEARTRKGATQEELASIAGVNRGMISFWENDKCVCRDKVKVQLLADFLGCDFDWLMYGKEVSAEKPKEIRKFPDLTNKSHIGIITNTPKPKDVPQVTMSEPVASVVYKAEDGRRLDDINMIIRHMRDMNLTREEKIRCHKTLSHFRTQLETVVLFGE